MDELHPQPNASLHIIRAVTVTTLRCRTRASTRPSWTTDRVHVAHRLAMKELQSHLAIQVPIPRTEDRAHSFHDRRSSRMCRCAQEVGVESPVCGASEVGDGSVVPRSGQRVTPTCLHRYPSAVGITARGKGGVRWSEPSVDQHAELLDETPCLLLLRHWILLQTSRPDGHPRWRPPDSRKPAPFHCSSSALGSASFIRSARRNMSATHGHSSGIGLGLLSACASSV